MARNENKVPHKTKSSAVGIDLGTTTCAVAEMLDESQIRCFEIEDNDKLIPSAIYIDDRIEFGKQALALGLDNPDAVVEAFKRDMGEPHFHRKVRHQWVPPEVLSAFLLEEIRLRASAHLGDVREAVITVPAYFDERRRKATLEAGRLAGYNVLDIVNEPVAAALTDFHHTGQLDAREDRHARLLVYDLGGGTFDVSVLEIKGAEISTLSSDGDVRLGGRDFDERLVDFIAERFHDHHGIDPRSDFGFLQRLWATAQRAKHELSHHLMTSVVLSFAGMRQEIEICRDEFEDLIEPLIERTIVTSMDALEQAGLTWQQLDKVLMVGGSSRIPLVAEKLTETVGRPPVLSHEPDLAVAMGAALFAKLMASKKDGPLRIVNVNAHSLGIAGVDVRTGEPVNRILIPRNSRLPASRRQKFVTKSANQRSVEIKIVEGENENPNYCVPVGKCIVTLSPDLPQRTEILVTCRYSSNGTISVSGLVPLTHESAHVEVRRDGFMELETLPVWRDRLLRGVTSTVPLDADLPMVPSIDSPDSLDHTHVLKRIDYLCQLIGEACMNHEVASEAVAAQRQVVSARREFLALQYLLRKVRSEMSVETDVLNRSRLQSSAAALRTYLGEVERYFVFARIALGSACIKANSVPNPQQQQAQEVRDLLATVGQWTKS